MRHKLAAQLYTLRNEVKKDFPGTLRELKKMGWSAVQIDGLYGYDPRELASVMNEIGLKTAGMHVGLERMKHDLAAVLEEARLFNTKDFICHSLPDELMNPAGYESVRKDLRQVASQVKELGFRAGYHNHDFEFHTSINGQYALDYVLELDPENPVYAEIDTYWVKKADLDPLTYIQKYASRMPILHLKDMTADGNRYFAEIGTGIIDFVPIIQWGERNGVEWYAVEQDYCPGNPMDSLALSYANIMKMEPAIMG
ncbi:sugar phosphate isomerase [Paenibacillus baekrokdamisoli]|uniref:Sugar phosphate isomerase n=1 Tax=Paenibacillus baekrokdamisoli TaxID=1712516 RepID=A0A3G9JL53_9BACL|nr:sugar phosphate isomerase/epimerase [Paenibacillus baekrokdamisoli]MBB3068948.1 sugar phosphate isomerase/epimerase [Paenibacillus baekrokdamisoli]BBH23769.1 sugar phosphate isomerase [Paenibacillus baekrokdamisoli]